MKITNVKARQIIDSRGNPTVEADLELDGKFMGRAAVPSGASTGIYEALELRDGDPANYFGQSVEKAVSNVNTKIKDLILNKEIASQKELDEMLIALDGTESKTNLGANAILSVSLAYAWAVSKAKGIQLFEYIGELYGNTNFKMPRPMLNIMNGGKHANWATDIQEYMVLPVKAKTWAESIKVGCEIYHALEKLLKAKGLSVNVGNEGGFAPALTSNEEALQLVVEAVAKAGYVLGEDVCFAFDAAASEFYNEETGNYDLKRDKTTLTPKQMVDWIVELTKKYPIISLEDMLSQDDWAAWQDLTARVGDKIQIVGDDLLVTNVKRVERGIAEKACNALLVKLNQIGSLTETLAAMKLSQSAGWNNVVSHRSGETEDVTIAHLVVGTGCGQIKTGAPSRSERTAKYNELIRIEEYINEKK
jgi:enolase